MDTKKTKFKIIILLAIIITGCSSYDIEQYTISGSITGGANKYLKYIDMTRPGILPDSVLIDQNNSFLITKPDSQPRDLVLYILPQQSIRIIAGVNQKIIISGQADNLTATYNVSGSAESERLSELLKKQYQTNYIIDTLQKYYYKIQTDANFEQKLDTLIMLGDSLFNNYKNYSINFINQNPASIASYVALAQKIGNNSNVFSIKTDYNIFYTVDTALQRVYANTAISNMLTNYIKKNTQLTNQPDSTNKSTIGNNAPEIALPNIWGDTLRLSKLRGKYVLVDFWGSWCLPCRNNNKHLRNMYRKYRYYGFDIYQVALEHSKADWKNSLREDKIYWPNQVSELNYMNSKTARAYNVKAIPANFIIDKEGKIIATDLFDNELDNFLSSLLMPQKTVANN